MGLVIVILLTFFIGFIAGSVYIRISFEEIGFKFKYENGKWFRVIDEQ